jgi:hypothetical protein
VQTGGLKSGSARAASSGLATLPSPRQADNFFFFFFFLEGVARFAPQETKSAKKKMYTGEAEWCPDALQLGKQLR